MLAVEVPLEWTDFDAYNILSRLFYTASGQGVLRYIGAYHRS